MSQERSNLDFAELSIKPGTLCWQINNDQLEPPLANGDWEDAIAATLIGLAEAHETSVLMCATDSGMSVDFGEHGFSVWVACAGSPPMVKAFANLIEELIPSQSLKRGYTDRSQNWRERINMADGKVWIPLDAVTWMEVTRADTEHESDSPEDDTIAPDSNPDEQFEAPQSSLPKNAKRKPSKAQAGVAVGYYQRKVERLLGLPEGSVKFVNPDRSISHPTQLIGNLRAKWSDD